MLYRIVAVVLIFVLLLACYAPSAVTRVPELSPVAPITSVASPVPGVTATPAPASPPAPGTRVPALPVPQAPERPQLSLAAVLDYAAQTVAVHEVITYPNTTGTALAELVFDVRPDETPGILTLETFAVDGVPALPERSGARWRTGLPAPLAPGGVTRVDVAYTLALPALGPETRDRAGGLGHTARQTNLSNWYPVVAAYRAGEWLVHPAFGPGESQAYEAADYAVEFTLRNAPPGTVVAASAGTTPQAHEGETRYRYAVAGLRTFGITASPAYEVAQSESAGVIVRAYTFPEHRAAGEAALAIVTQAVDVFGRAFGPYPYAELAVVEADFFDGLELAGMFFVGKEYYAEYRTNPRNWLTVITIHEAAHQWWYGLVGNDQALEPWLDEALTTYSEYVYYEAVHPYLVEWWWDFRVWHFNPAGKVDSTIYEIPEYRPYVNAVYLRGVLFLRDLRAALGDEAFFAFLRRYFAAYRMRLATADDFWATLGPAAHLDALKAEYFRP